MSLTLTPKRMFYAMGGLTVLLLCGVVAAVVVGNLWLQKQSNSLKAVKLNSRLIDEQQAAVINANKDIQKYADLEQVANLIVPQDKDQARTVREIAAFADQNDVPISSISFPSSSLGNSSSSSNSAAASSDSSSSSKTATPKASSQITQTLPVQGITGVYQMLVTVQSDTSRPVNYGALINFLRALETNRRSAQVDNITIKPDPSNPQMLSFQLGINVFIKP